jgi:molybdopterin molybdotransferase
MTELLGFTEARERVLASAVRVPVEEIDVASALGRVLAEPVRAGGPLPPFSYSAMDGYALLAAGLTGPAPWSVPVSGESRTGHVPEPLVPAHACRISTGARIPDGADAVLPVELVERSGAGILVRDAVRSGQHVRRAGEDLEAGAVALPSGKRLDPACLGLLASLDRVEVTVARRPRVVVVCTGDELRAAGSAAVPGKIPDSISLPLSALAARAGADVLRVVRVKDEREPTEHAVRAALQEADLLLTVGGVSVGEHDWVRTALASEGIVIDFYKVAIKPGKPVTFGRRGPEGPSVLALPGNPASALITFALFGMPLLRAMQGDAEPLPRVLRMTLTNAVRHKPGRLELLRARLERGPASAVTALENQASGALTSLALADALLLFPAESAELPAGASVDVLSWADF